MGIKSKHPLLLIFASLFVTSTLALRLLNEEKTEGDGLFDAIMNQHHHPERKYEECRRRCQRQGHRGQGQQWQCQRRCQEEYSYERERGRRGRYGEWDDDEVEVVEEFDNQRYGPQQRYRECQRRCQRLGGQRQCKIRCEEYEQERWSIRGGGGQAAG